MKVFVETELFMQFIEECNRLGITGIFFEDAEGGVILELHDHYPPMVYYQLGDFYAGLKYPDIKKPRTVAPGETGYPVS